MSFSPRQKFDLAAPFKASAVILTAGKRFEVGKPFPWRQLGISESDIFALWHAGQVDCLPAPAANKLR